MTKHNNFNPGISGLWNNPFYFARKGLYVNIKKHCSDFIGKILDVGCGSKPYRALFSTNEYIGMDIERSGHSHQNENIDVYYTGDKFPFKDNEFDNIVCFQVFEHVFNPNDFLKETNRVLKIKGKLLLTVPFVWDEHEQPYDYARYSSFGIKHLLEKNGYSVLSQDKTYPNIATIFQIKNAYLFKIWHNTKLDFLYKLIFPINNILGVLLQFIMPKNNDLYLDNIIVAEKKK